jgi:hypothetical protein
MSSTALSTWQDGRRDRIEELLDVHQLIGSKRRWGTSQINSALILRLAAEFQGFCRDLHDLAAGHFVASMVQENPRLDAILTSRLIKERKLNRGNASPGALGSDFGLLGMTFWAALEDADSRAKHWNQSLEALNDARNAIAHSDEDKLARLKQNGYPVILQTVRDWFRMLDSLAGTMDNVVSAHLDEILAGGRPW